MVDNSRKPVHAGKSIFTFAMGDRPFYDFLDRYDAVEAHPVEHVSDHAVIRRHERMVSVNATLQVDLAGACNSEHLDGRQYSGAGGQLDFVRRAGAAHRGKSIIACHATAAKGTVSRIVARLTGPVTTPRNDVGFIVTEFGIADLRGRSIAERAAALTAIAHPNFREVLARDFRDGK